MPSRRESVRDGATLAAALGLRAPDRGRLERTMAETTGSKTPSPDGRILRTQVSAYARLKARESQYSFHAENRKQWRAWREQFRRRRGEDCAG